MSLRTRYVFWDCSLHSSHFIGEVCGVQRDLSCNMQQASSKPRTSVPMFWFLIHPMASLLHRPSTSPVGTASAGCADWEAWCWLLSRGSLIDDWPVPADHPSMAHDIIGLLLISITVTKNKRAGNVTKQKCYIADIKNKKLKKTELKGKWQSGKYTKFMPG